MYAASSCVKCAQSGNALCWIRNGNPPSLVCIVSYMQHYVAMVDEFEAQWRRSRVVKVVKVVSTSKVGPQDKSVPTVAVHTRHSKEVGSR